MPIDFEPSPEQQALFDSVLHFARHRLEEVEAAPEAGTGFARARWDACAEVGLTGLTVDEAYGGQGADALTAVIAMEALGQGSADNGLIFSLNAHLWSAAMPIQRFGSDSQRRRWLPGLCDGSLVGVQAMTEPDAGSDAFSLRTTARATDAGWVLDGSKVYITNAPVADVFVVFATTDPDRGWAGLSAFLVERDAPGLVVGPPVEKVGLRSSPMAEVVLNGCAVSEDALLGRPGAGTMVFNHSMEWERGCILASAVGAMQRQVDRSVAYARERRQFGQPIGSFQAVGHRIVDMRVRVEAARLLLRRMAWRKSRGESVVEDAALVKLFVSEGWVQTSLDQLQIHGGAGYLADSGVGGEVADALASRIYSGTSDIQRNLLARRMGL